MEELIPQSVQKVIGLECVESTQALARELASSGEDANTLVLACHQTAAQDRQGRAFAAPEGGVYFTLILRPRKTLLNPEHLSLRAAQAVCDALQIFGLKTKTKQPGDALVWYPASRSWKKIAGAWTEISEDPANPFVLLGVGVYLNNKLSAGQKQTAASVKQFTRQDASKELFLDDVLDNFFLRYAEWEASSL